MSISSDALPISAPADGVMAKRAIRRTVSSVFLVAAINYVMVVIVSATAAAIVVQTASAIISEKFLAVATALKRASF